MLNFFGAGGRAAAIMAFAALFVSPTEATAQADARVSAVFQSVPPAASISDSAVASVQTAPAPAQVTTPAVPRPLKELVGAFVNSNNQDDEQLCLAKAVYFEARGESLEGQVAVAEVVLNRAASGRYPTTLCGVVTQPWQFSFIRGGKFPAVKQDSEAWHTALAIADIARNQLAIQIPANVLWYHASYVSPSWGKRLTRIARIGTHIFYG